MFGDATTPRSRQNDDRKDAQEEFFKLLILAFKMRHVKISPAVMKYDGSQMYLDIKDKKPFYEWPQWVESNLRIKMLRDKYGHKTKKETEFQIKADE